MLFPLDPTTARCKIFTGLNTVLMNFFHESINSNEFSQDLFPGDVGAACWDNEPTREKFEQLWDELSALSVADRQCLHDTIANNQEIRRFFIDRMAPFPTIQPDSLKTALGKLTKHLYLRSKDLVDVCRACGNESIQNHFETFRTQNGNICAVCGTELLAQRREDVPDGDQWRSAYDHLLSKDKYPAYAIHPDNLLPICDTCNSKAKGADELLVASDKTTRRLSFYPHEESCHEFVEVKLTYVDIAPDLIVSWVTGDPNTSEKLAAWDEIYEVKSRVEGEQSDFVAWLDSECQPVDLNDFSTQISRKSQPPTQISVKNECWKFWRYKLYVWIQNQGYEVISQIWAMIEKRRSDDDSFAVYGI